VSAYDNQNKIENLCQKNIYIYPKSSIDFDLSNMTRVTSLSGLQLPKVGKHTLPPNPKVDCCQQTYRLGLNFFQNKLIEPKFHSYVLS
jgi:hypothetical protein